MRWSEIQRYGHVGIDSDPYIALYCFLFRLITCFKYPYGSSTSFSLELLTKNAKYSQQTPSLKSKRSSAIKTAYLHFLVQNH